MRTITLIAALLLLTLTPTRADDLPHLPLADTPLAYDVRAALPNTIYDTERDKPLPFEHLIADLATADVVILGEHHTNDDVHQMQARILAALAGLPDGRRRVLAMEFLNHTQNDLLDTFINSDMTTDDLVDQAGWYTQGGYPFAYFRPLIDTAKAHALPIRGLNVPRSWIGAAMRDALTDEQKATIGPLAEIHPAHRYMVADMMDMAADGAAMMMPVQRMWDAAMANATIAAIAEHAPEPVTIIVIVGIGHAAHGHGIPERLNAVSPDLDVRVVAPAVAVRPDPNAPVHPGFEPKEQAVFTRGYARYVHVLPDREGVEVYADPGLRFDKEDPETGATISRLRPPASLTSLREGDVLIRIGDEPVTGGLHARRALGELTWDQRLSLTVLRNGIERTIPLLLVPPADGMLDWLVSEPLQRTPFTPLDDAPVTAAQSPDEDGRIIRLLSTNDRQRRPRRVDVLSKDGHLLEVWYLDDNARPTRALLARPDDNGAVEHLITRTEAGRLKHHATKDADGKIISARFYD